MFSHIKTLIGKINDDRILSKLVFIKIVQDPADIPVERCGGSQVIPHIPLVFPFRKRIAR